MTNYDIANWRPCTPVAYLEHLGQATLTLDNPDTLTVKVEQLADARIRTVLIAQVKLYDETGAPYSEMAPYLMTIYCPETGKSLCFVSNSNLADE